VLPHLIAVDWGTSSLRGARLDAAGKVLEERSAPLGILNVPNGDFAGLFSQRFSDWMKPAGTLCLISGMAGSRQGWAEAPYVSCPAGPAELAKHLHWIERDRIAIVPGLSDVQTDVPDVMRGEEVQIFGAMRLGGLSDGLFVLPDTHSKWATALHGKVAGFRTYMTGEVYGLLAQHSILARTLDAAAPLDQAAFLQGVERAGNGQGLLIGEELAQQTLPSTGEVIVIGSPALAARYALALKAKGATARIFGAEATWAGLGEIGRGMR